MKYERKFTVNGKSVEDFCEGSVKQNLVFKDEETGKEYRSFYDMVRTQAELNAVGTESTGTTAYHRTAPYSRFFYTDGVAEFVETHKAYWLLDVIESYIAEVCNVLPRTKSNGEYEFCENENGVDNFLVVSLIKLSDNSAVFSIEHEDGEGNYDENLYNKTVAFQYIPFTDIDVDHVEWFIESGVVLFSMEH